MWLVVNTMLLLPGLIWSLRRTVGRGHWLSSSLVIWGATALFLFLWPWIYWPEYAADLGFNAIITFGIGGMYLADLLIRPAVPERIGALATRALPGGVAWAGALIYVLYWAYRFGAAVASAGSVQAAFAVPRAFLHLTTEYFAGQSLIDLAMVLPQTLYWIGLPLVWRRSKIAFTVSLMVILLGQAATSATRFGITAQLMTVLLYLSGALRPRNGSAQEGIARRRSSAWGRFSKRKLRVLVTLALVFMAGLLYQYAGNFVRTGALTGLFNPDALRGTRIAEALVMDLGYYEYLHDLYVAIDNGRLAPDNGMAIVLNVLSLVPRRLWPEKPITATSVRLTEALHGGVGTGQPIYTYTIFGEGYYEARYLGAFLAAPLFIGAYAILFRLLSRLAGTELLACFWMFMMIPQFRAEFPFAGLVSNMVAVSALFLLSSRRRLDGGSSVKSSWSWETNLESVSCFRTGRVQL